MKLYDQFQFPISREAWVHILIFGQPTQEAVDKMIAFLNEMRDTYPTKAELEAEKRKDDVVIGTA